MEDLLKKQECISKKIDYEYGRGNFTITNPYVVLNPYEVCPLSALIRFSTDKDAIVTIEVQGFIQHYNKYKREHIINVIGLLENTNNKVKILCSFSDGSKKCEIINIETEKLPEEYPEIELCSNNINDKDMSQLYGLSLGKSNGVRTIKHLYSMIDNTAKVRWLYLGVSCHVFTRLNNGNILVDAPISSGICGAYTSAGFIEIDLLGKIINYYYIENGMHHDVYELPNGNFLAITQRENTKQDLLVEVDRESGKIINEYNFREILDMERDTVIDKVSVNHPLDWLHLNSIIYDNKDNCIIASSRNQSTVVKFNKDTKEIKWILAPHHGWKEKYKKYLLTPIGENFEWSWAQHTPQLTQEENILVFDNGNFRSYNIEDAILAHENYSRAVEYKVNEEDMTIEQVWQYGKQRGNELYCSYLGAVRILENNNRLICFGGITKDIFGNPIDDMKSDRMKNRIEIFEVTSDEDAKVLFHVKIKNKNITTNEGYKCYRCEKFIF